MRGLSRRSIRTLFDVGTVAGSTDGQLLERFATRRDEGAELAFAALVERHGPMVLRACRGILGDDHEAMDAFQATFLVLARKGGSLWVRDSLGPWLHRVACRAAGRARSSAARRRMIEARAAEMAEARDGGDDLKELAAVVHEEIDRLPERYRSTVVLCDLEGRTCEEAARHLGCPVGTVGSRLARGRQRLRDRLRRRGLAPDAGLLAASAGWQGPGASIPSTLAGSTAGAAVRFVSIRAAIQGSAATLAQGVLRTMAMTRWWKVASLLLALGASTTGVVSLAGKGAADAGPRPDDAPKAAPADDVAVSEVKPGKLSVVVDERGNLEASRNAEVYSMVEGVTTILSIVPEGTRVAKGQLACELDSSALRDQLVNQRIATKGAEAVNEQAKLARELAEMAVKEYEDGIYPQEFRTVLGEIELAQSAIAEAEERLKRTRAARERLDAMMAGQGGSKTPADVVVMLDVDDRIDDTEQALGRARGALKNWQTKRDVLEKYTKAKMVKQLRNEVDKAQRVELAKQSALEIEKSRVAKLERQIASCKILAPADGMMVYANNPRQLGGQLKPAIEEGATVRERQRIFSIPDLGGPMRVNAKVPESWIDQITLGLTARIKVDAFPGETFSGVVESVAPLPDPTNLISPGPGDKVYTTNVTITKGIPGLRPGMSARVEILIAALDDVLSVPVQAVVWYDDKDHVAVKTPDGGIVWREVILGRSNGKVVEVKEGLKSGEAVALEPAPLLSEEQRRKVAQPPRRPVGTPKGAGALKAKGKDAGVLKALRTKLQAIAPEDRARMKDASPEENEAILKKAGVTDDEIRQYNQSRQRPGAPR